MKKFLTPEMIRRILMTIGGVLVAGFSVGMFKFSTMGVDPFQVLANGIHILVTSLVGEETFFSSFGTLYTIVNALMLIAIFFLDKKKIGLGTVINIFLVGYVADFSYKLWLGMIENPSFLLKFAFLIVAIVIMCFASALYFTGDLGVSTYDAIALMISERQSKVKFQYCRIATDLICVIGGFLLGARFTIIGIGTIITAFFMGPLIAFFNKTVAIPLRYGKKK